MPESLGPPRRLGHQDRGVWQKDRRLSRPPWHGPARRRRPIRSLAPPPAPPSPFSRNASRSIVTAANVKRQPRSVPVRERDRIRSGKWRAASRHEVDDHEDDADQEQHPRDLTSHLGNAEQPERTRDKSD